MITNPDASIIHRRKANYGPRNDTIDIRWSEGAFVVDAPISIGGLTLTTAEEKADTMFLDMLAVYEAEGRPISSTPSANFAPVFFANDPRSKGFSKRGLRDAMNRLFAAKRIEVVEFGPPSKRRNRVVTAKEEGSE
ncbi:hypothetical protein SAMN05444161_7044 [Rhizobiales bacterium GAS191]|nr:hypothetical protein SAMN05444161_7044 [Rhizobiales bacterium GAS191]